MVTMGSARPPIFRKRVDGSHSLSFDYSVEQANPNDFALDVMIQSNVPLENSPIVEDLSLDSLDTIDKNATKIFQSEKFIEKD